MAWTSVLQVVVYVLVTLAVAAIGFGASTRVTEKAHRHQIERDFASADREYAWRAEEHFRPYIDRILSASRAINQAATTWAADIGDIPELDQCIDHLASSAMTRAVASAETEMRMQAIAFQSALGLQIQLSDMMPRGGGLLRPDVGEQVVAANTEASAIRDAVFAATLGVRNQVNALVAGLESRQRGVPLSP